MGCYTTAEEIKAYEESTNKSKYGLHVDDRILISEVACKLAKTIRENNLFDGLPPFVKKWIIDHELRDKKLSKPNKQLNLCYN